MYRLHDTAAKMGNVHTTWHSHVPMLTLDPDTQEDNIRVTKQMLHDTWVKIGY
jgi:hypothetical protein